MKQQIYFCQLGQFRNTKNYSVGDYDGLYVWIIGERPRERTMLQGDGRRLIETCLELCMVGGRNSKLAVAPSEVIELLPYFSQQVPVNEDIWLAKGGEQIPEEEELDASLRHAPH